jgi:hypothetical protein
MPTTNPTTQLTFGGVNTEDPKDRRFMFNTWGNHGGIWPRKGFGARAIFDAGFGAYADDGQSTGADNDAGGIEHHVGSTTIRTAFTGDQVISLYTVHAYPMSTAEQTTRAEKSRFYVVRIQDMATGGVWEQAVYRLVGDGPQAESNRGSDSPGYFRFAFESNIESRYDSLIPASKSPPKAWFVNLSGVLYFGNVETGPLVYRPSIFPRNMHGESRRGNGRESVRTPHPGIQTWRTHDEHDGRAEPTLVRPLVPSNGHDADLSTYLTPALFQSPTAAFAHDGRLVLIKGNEVLFSDRPGTGGAAAFSNANIVFVPSPEELVAGVSLRGNILLFTATTTWVLRPGRGFLASEGILDETNDGTGCLGQESIVVTNDGMVVWASNRGIHAASTVSNIRTISDDIDSFFTDYVENPFSTHFVNQVFRVHPHDDANQILHTQGRMTWSRGNSIMVGAYWSAERLLLYSVPDQNLVLVYDLSENYWMFWPLESVVVGDRTALADGTWRRAGVTAELPDPWILANDKNVWLIVGPSNQAYVLENVRGDNWAYAPSLALLEFGYGGGLDRSHELKDDQRRGPRRRKLFDPHTVFPTDPRADIVSLRLGQPYPMVVGEINIETEGDAAPEGAVWLPVEIRWMPYGNVDNGVSQIDFRFQIDPDEWTPVTDATNTNIVFALDSTRIGTGPGWTITQENAGGAPTVGGDWVHVVFDGDGVAATWTQHPFLNLPQRREATLLYIPMHTTVFNGDASGRERLEFAQAVDTCKVGHAAATFENGYCWAWEEMWSGSQGLKDNAEAQAVDWLVRPQAFNIDGMSRVQLRTLFVRLLAFGQQLAAGEAYPTPDAGVDFSVTQFQAGRIVPPFPLGLFQVALMSDNGSNMVQVLDVAASPQSGDVSTPAFRIEEHFPGTLRYKDFIGTGANVPYRRLVFSLDGPVWGHALPNAPEQGSYRALIGGSEHADVAVSSSVTGDTVEVTLYGSVRGWAEQLAVISGQANVRKKGRRRAYRR